MNEIKYMNELIPLSFIRFNRNLSLHYVRCVRHRLDFYVLALRQRYGVVVEEVCHDRHLEKLRDEDEVGRYRAPYVMRAQLLKRPDPKYELEQSREGHCKYRVTQPSIYLDSLLPCLFLEHVELRSHRQCLSVHGRCPHEVREEFMVQ